MALLKLCRCGKVIKINKLHCDRCTDKNKDRHKIYDKYKRDKECAAFYKSKAWRELRNVALVRDNGLCQHCLKSNRIKQADMVDHIIPIKEDWLLRLNLNNLQSLCNLCHNKKTYKDKERYEGVHEKF